MELSKKTTILLSPQLHDRLTQLARHKGISMGQLMREACEKTYGLTSRERRLDAALDSNVLMYAAGSEHLHNAPSVRFLEAVAKGFVFGPPRFWLERRPWSRPLAGNAGVRVGVEPHGGTNAAMAA